MKHKLFMYLFLPVIGLAVLTGVNVSSAHGWFGGGFGAVSPDEIATQHQSMFQNMAQLLGVSVDVVKSGWAAGKSFNEIAQENGIDEVQFREKMKNARTEQMKSQFQALVEKGIITQTQADQRLQVMQNRNQSGEKGKMEGFRGPGGSRGCGGLFF